MDTKENKYYLIKKIAIAAQQNTLYNIPGYKKTSIVKFVAKRAAL